MTDPAVTAATTSRRQSPLRAILRMFRVTLVWVGLFAATAWTFGALWFDFPVKVLRHPLAVCFVLGALAALFMVRPVWRAKAGLAAVILAVIAWWFTLRPSNNRVWQPDVAQQAWAEVDGNMVTLHNVRNCDYRTDTDYTVHWETRTVDLAKITGVDIAICRWGATSICHPLLSFRFADAVPVAISIETRKEAGEAYSAIRGLYRQYELIYLAADERDVLRVRTNYRVGEDIYLYHTNVTPAAARERFLDYLASMNELRQHPRWYNAVTTNCTTSIRTQHKVSQRLPWDSRLLVNGKIDQMLFELGVLATDGLPFAELHKQALITPAAKAADQSPDFSRLIRENRPGFRP